MKKVILSLSLWLIPATKISIITLITFLWVDSWLRLYPSLVFVLVQTALICGLLYLLSDKAPFWSLTQQLFTLVTAGWLISIVSHQILSAIYINNFVDVWRQRIEVNAAWGHIWFVSYSSLLFMGPVQALFSWLLPRPYIKLKQAVPA